jgi:hypothetical protein
MSIQQTNVWKTIIQVQRMPFQVVGHAFWLKNAPIMFMSMMEDILKLFTNYFVVIYLYDILILKKTWAKNLEYIQ